MSNLATPYRTHTCGELRSADDGKIVRLAGWVHRRRDMGHLIFLDLRDRHGITQVVIDADLAPEAHAIASKARNEYVLQVEGEVADRLPGTHNPRLATGDVEVARLDAWPSSPRRRRRRSTSTTRTPRWTRRCGSSTATSTSGASRWRSV